MSKLVSHLLFAVLVLSHASATDRCTGVDRAKLQQYRSLVIQLQGQLESLRNANASSEVKPKQLQNVQKELLDAIEQEQCAEALQFYAEKGKGKQNFLLVPLIYATDRRHSSQSPDYYSDLQKLEGIDYGLVDAVIPDLANGAVLLPGVQNVVHSNEPAQGYIKEPRIISQNAFDKMISDQKRQSADVVRVLLFVHGYDVLYHEAAISAATLAVSLKAKVIPVFYSWPSAGRKAQYWHDEDTVRTSYVRFLAFLEHLLVGPADEVEIVFHSMGARIITPALGELARKGVTTSKLRKVAFAAADISVDEFQAQWPDLKRLPNVEWTLYESSKDGALLLSHYVHIDHRLGDSDHSLYILPGGDTIDASAAASMLQFMGHSYLVHSSAVGQDLGEWISQDLPPSSRGLQKSKQGSDVYWRLP